MLHFDEIVFGPIFSRRLGSSLGVNILPAEGKLCNFDCIYCECGWNKDGIAQRRFPTLDEVSAALESRMSEAAEGGVRVDSITFSGNGEPTMNPDFPAIIDVTLQLRDRYFPNAKIVADRLYYVLLKWLIQLEKKYKTNLVKRRKNTLNIQENYYFQSMKT